jgi:sugar/nucleoside kinase (ribokinase family)
MANFDIYGIGNALVDMECEVPESFIEQMKLDKGHMTLVDAARQEELLMSLPAGALKKRGCGGSAANTLIAVASLEGKAFYTCRVANDETGLFYHQDLKNAGVASSLDSGLHEGVTGKCMVFVTPDASRTMNTFLGITEQLSPIDLRADDLKRSKLVYLEGYLVTSPTGLQAAIKGRQLARENSIPVALTFSDPAMVRFFASQIQEMMGSTPLDYLFANEEEASTFAGSEDLQTMIAKVRSVSKHTAITRGPKGALIVLPDQVIEVSAPKVKALDTNGAGDLFAGSYLWAMGQNIDISRAGHFASFCASALVTRLGARLPAAELLQLKKQFLEG